MQTPSFSQKLKYRYEQFIGKGGAGIFWSLLILFFIGYFVALIFRLLFPTETAGVLTIAWRTLKEVIDPGNVSLADGESFVSRIGTMIAVLIGVVLFSMVIAFITTTIDNTIADFRKGRGKVWEKNHTLILGWNERVIDIVRELIIANESEKNATIVILADGVDKEQMDDELNSRIADTKTTKIVTTPGYPASIAELERVQAAAAKSIIIMAHCTENAVIEDKELSDNRVLKSIMALRAVQGGQNKLPIVAEIFTEEKRELVSYFNDDNILALDSWNIMGKLMVQTSLTGGLEMVYHELFGFDGSEMYFYKANWGKIGFYDLAYHFPNGIPIGIYREEEGKHPKDCIMIHPKRDTLMQPNDEILILAEDDSNINFSPSPVIEPHDYEDSKKRLERKKKRVIMLGWHDVAHIYIKESADYLTEGASFDIMMANPTAEMLGQIENLRTEIPQYQINLIEKNPMSLPDLASVNPLDYEMVLILSQEAGEHEPEKVDADTMVILLLLRKIRKNAGKRKEDTTILTQILNSENEELIHQTDVDDFIISNKLITKILAQLSEQPRMKWVYDELFQAEGSEIYVKPANLYFEEVPQSLRFVDLMGAAFKRNEICIGYRLGAKAENAKENFGIYINPDKNTSLSFTEQDFVIVIAIDER